MCFYSGLQPRKSTHAPNVKCVCRLPPGQQMSSSLPSSHLFLSLSPLPLTPGTTQQKACVDLETACLRSQERPFSPSSLFLCRVFCTINKIPVRGVWPGERNTLEATAPWVSASEVSSRREGVAAIKAHADSELREVLLASLF